MPNINQFKEGDIITRVEPCIYKVNDIKDGSYIGERIILLGHDRKAKIIFFQLPDSAFGDDINSLSYGRDGWDDGWEYYPEKLWQKLLKKFS